MNPQVKVQEILIAQRNEALEKLRMCLAMYNKLNRKVDVKKLEDYKTKELLAAIWARLVKLFRKSS